MKEKKETVGSSSDLRRSNEQNSSDQESKFVYVMKATRRYQSRRFH